MPGQKSKERQKNKLFSLIDDAPFAGKFVIKDAYVGFETASDKAKTVKMLGFMALMGVMVWAHAKQTQMSGESLLTHASEIMQGNGDAMNTMYTTIDVLYTGAMAAVTARQAALTGNVLKKYKTWREQKDVIPESERRPERRDYRHKLGAIGLAAAVTLAGQAAGYMSMQDAKTTEWNHKIEQIEVENAKMQELYGDYAPTQDNTPPLEHDVPHSYDLPSPDTTSIPITISGEG